MLTKGWELLSISTITSGSPFTVYSGIQQTGYGTVGADRPDQIGKPNLSTARSATRRREDYFGIGANNASYFSIPIGIPGGTGPNSGRFGTLGRNTFRGPAYYDFDYALIKTTPIGHRQSGLEKADLQFRGRVLQPVQHGEYGAAREHHQGLRVWRDQQNRRNVAADPVFAQAYLLIARASRQRSEKYQKN